MGNFQRRHDIEADFAREVTKDKEDVQTKKYLSSSFPDMTRIIRR